MHGCRFSRFCGVSRPKHIRAIDLFRRDLDDIGIVGNRVKRKILPPKGHNSTAEKIPLQEKG